MSESTLYRGGQVYSPADPTATALLVRGSRIAWLGAPADAPAAGRVVDLAGALVTPAFVDAHVHVTDTGLAMGGLDVAAARSAGEVLDAVAGFATGLPADAVVLGHGWDESRWPRRQPPSAAELDRAAGGRMVYLAQASVHSAACSTALLAAAPAVGQAPGYHASGWVRRDAHHAVRAVLRGVVRPAQRAVAQQVALRRAAALGIAAVHECGGPHISSEADFTALLKLAGTGGLAGDDPGPGAALPEVYGYWGELCAAGKAGELGAVGAGGDLLADGAFGAHTAHLSEPYQDVAGRGHGYLSAEQVCAHLLDCAVHRMQGGFHAIGDAAVATVLAGFVAASARLGAAAVRAGRHRVEHAELLDKRLIAGLVEHGVVASVQPAFDRLWGGPDRMYATRLGVARALSANPLASLHGVGVGLAFGSDSPVTALDPWGTVRAAVWHRNPAQRMSVRAAFAAHTRGGWRALGDHAAGGPARRDPFGVEGVLVPGAPATFAVWDTPAGTEGGLPVLAADGGAAALPVCRATVLRGRTIFEEGSTPGG